MGEVQVDMRNAILRSVYSIARGLQLGFAALTYCRRVLSKGQVSHTSIASFSVGLCPCLMSLPMWFINKW